MTNKIVSLELNGTRYTWNGKFWYETKTFMNPPTSVSGRLDTLLGRKLGLRPRVARASVITL